MSEAATAALPPREYEAVYILRPDLTKEASERVAQRVSEVIAREGGTLTVVENWGRRPMSYEIQHYKRGVYVYITYLGNGVLVAELERNFRMLEEVMRFQTVKINDKPETVEVDAERVKFEAVEPLAEGEDEDMTLEQELGLVQAQRSPRFDDDRADGGAAGPVGVDDESDNASLEAAPEDGGSDK